MDRGDGPSIGQLIRSARQHLRISQDELLGRLIEVSGRTSITRERIGRWEADRQVPRAEWRHWLSVVLEIPGATLDSGAVAARRRNRLGRATVVTAPPARGTVRRTQGTPALLPIFRSRVQAGILAATLLNPHRAFSLTELANFAGGSLASVSKEAQGLEDAGILSRRINGTIRLMRAVTDTPVSAALTPLVRQTIGVPQIIAEELSRVMGTKRIMITGEWAERFAGQPGTMPATVELHLVYDPDVFDEDQLAAAIRRARHRLQTPITVSMVSTCEQNPTDSPTRQNDHPLVDVAAIPPAGDPPPVIQRWAEGGEVIDALLHDGQLEFIGGADATAEPYLHLAAEHLDAAERIPSTSREAAALLISQAAHLLGSGLLAHQGLQPSPTAESTVMPRAVTAQFGSDYADLFTRDRLDSTPETEIRGDVTDAVSHVRTVLASTRRILPRLGVFC